ncbi:MAG: hypothetical protein ACE5FF_11345 [Saprospiraceae bacterium]
MKSFFFSTLLILTAALLNGCCGSCDEMDNRTLSIQVIDDATGQNISDSLNFQTFSMVQPSQIGFPLVPQLSFGEGQIVAEFPKACGSRKIGASMDIYVNGEKVEVINITLKHLSKKCCSCDNTAVGISELTALHGSEIQLVPNANVLKIHIN